MVDDRTQEQIYADWVDTVNKCHKKGWVCNGGGVSFPLAELYMIFRRRI